VSVVPRGMAVQEVYRLYREGKLLVNRRYQRKLVWTEQEKVKLIDSILRSYPIPLILLAVHQGDSANEYEIIDGVQRLNAVCSFIENGFALTDGRFFDVREFTRAKQVAEQGEFMEADPALARLSPDLCAALLDYQLAITIYPAAQEEEITEVFGRINSSGKQLSNQERRQAGIVAPFADIVRELGAELRGDASLQELRLFDMPEISIGSRRAQLDYGLRAEDIFWCKQGILRVSQLRDSEDEELIADIAASILLGKPFSRSREQLDELYKPESELFERVNRQLVSHDIARLKKEIKATFSTIRETIADVSDADNFLRDTVNPGGGNPIKAAFYAIFMAFHRLLVSEHKVPVDPKAICGAIRDLQDDLVQSRHYTVAEDRTKNILKTYGLIQDHFASSDVPALGYGSALALDLENSLRRSRIETARYECKQGVLRLHDTRVVESGLLERLVHTICGIANVGPEHDGYLFVGVCDSRSDADRVRSLDDVEPYKVSEKYVVGVDREAKILGMSLEQYCDLLLRVIRESGLSEPLKQQVLMHTDIVTFHGFSVIRIRVPAQGSLSYVNDDVFVREGGDTRRVSGRQIVSAAELFA